LGIKIDSCKLTLRSNDISQYSQTNFGVRSETDSSGTTCKYDGYKFSASAVLDVANVKRKSDSSWDMPDIVFPILLRDKFNRSNVVIRKIEPVADFGTTWEVRNPVDESDNNYKKYPVCETMSIPNLISKLNEETLRKPKRPPEVEKGIDNRLKKSLGTAYGMNHRLLVRSILGDEKNFSAHYPMEVEITNDTFSLCGKKVYSGQLLKFQAPGDECDLASNGSLLVSGIPISENEKPRTNWFDDRKTFSCFPKPIYENNIGYFIRDALKSKPANLKINQVNFDTCECHEDQNRNTDKPYNP
jgi:hypothetical protein